MKNENVNVVICPPCGERACSRGFLSGVALATKRGANKVLPILPLLPRLTAVLPPQGREITARGFTQKVANKNCHPEFISGSTPLVITPYKEEILKQVQHDKGMGFTLIELLVVVLIIGILAAVAVPQYQKAVDKARVSELFAIVKNLKIQQEVFFLAHGHYANDCEELGVDVPSGFTQSSQDATSYFLTKTNYTLSFQCMNGRGTRAAGYISTDDGSLNINIEMFFDNYSDDSVTKDLDKGQQGKSFCSAAKKDTRSVNVCKSLGKEERVTGASYWL